MAENAFSFVLDNRLAAVTGVFSGGKVYAADGIDPRIYDVTSRGSECSCSEGCGCYDACPTARPYRVVRSDPEPSGRRFTAVTGDSARIYTLDGCFAETGFIAPRTGGRTVIDACAYRSGNGTSIAAAFGNAALGFSGNGEYKELLWRAPEDSFINSFWALTPDYCAACYSRNGTDFFTVLENGIERTAPVPAGLNLRSVFAGDDGLYGLFGENYLYNRIARIFANGAISFENARST
ncbi:MAG: hypothetical protein J6252_06450 [Clostridia bacterium]|nr:hypothetical protein [Clostridia bacterium]